MLLIKVRYFIQFASIYYIKGDYQNAKAYADHAHAICSDASNYTFETAESFKKSLPEAEQLKLRCEAKIRGVSSLSLKEKSEGEQEGPIPGSVAVAQSSFLPVLYTFGLFSSTTFLLTYTLMRR